MLFVKVIDRRGAGHGDHVAVPQKRHRPAFVEPMHAARGEAFHNGDAFRTRQAVEINFA